MSICNMSAMRNSPIHYIAPSNVSIIPNCNDTSNDIAVTIPLGTKIKVYAPEAGIEMENNTWQEWTITGRNRSLQDMFSPYTIFARLSKTDRNDGYIVFAPKTLLGYNKVSDRLFVGVYADKYSSVIRGGNGFSVLYKEGGVEHQNIDPNYYYIRLGDVSEVKVQNRTITFDTGILGTEQYNTDWLLNPYGLPLRIVLSCVVDGEDAGQIPYLQWGKEASLSAKLIEGWTDNHDSAVKLWTITRNTGHEEADREWNYPDADSLENNTPAPTDAHKMPSGNIILAHLREGTDDIDGVPNATFTITAWGVPDSSGVPDTDDLYDKPEDNSAITGQDENKEELAVLASANITIMAESDVMQGQMGDTPIQAFRWYVDGITPKTPTDTTKDVPAPADKDIIGDVTKAVPINTWSATAPGRPAETLAETWALWLTQSVRRMTNDGTATRDPWSTPVCISGAKGEPGEDSKEREWIYIPKPEETSFSGDSHPDNITVPATESKGQNKTDDDFVPSGWRDNAMSTNDNTNRFVYASWRDWIKNTKQWGPFSNPIIWSNWGRQGIDGDGTEYVYIRTKNKIAPIMDSVQTGYQNDRFRPTIDSASQTEAQTEQEQTTDNPKGTDSTYPYEWVAARSKERASDDGSRSWTKFTGTNNDYKMSLWSNWADSAADTYQLILQPGAVKYNEIGSSTYISFDILKNIAGEGVAKIDNTVRSEDGLFVAVQMKKTAEGEMKWYDISGWAFQLTKTYADLSEYMMNVELRKRLSGKTYDVETPSTYMVADAKTLIIAKDGENGESGHSVSPENVIINQSLTNPFGLSSVNQQVNITVRIGSNVYTPTSVIVDDITDILLPGASNTEHTKTTNGTAAFKINSIGTYSYTEDDAQKTQYYDKVTFQLSVTFPKDGQSITVTHYVNLYVNLLGSFKTIIEADVEQSIAQKEYAILNGDGTVDKYVDLATYIRSSSQNLAKITKAVTDEDGTYISSSEIKQTADKITLEVSSQAKNIKGRNFLVGSGFYAYKRYSDKKFSFSHAFYEVLKELNPTPTNPVYIGISVWYFAFDADIDSTTGGNVGRLGISPQWKSGGVNTHNLELMAGVDGSNRQVNLYNNILTRAKRVEAFTSVTNPNNYYTDQSRYYNQLSPKSASRSMVGFAKVEILTANDTNLITDWSYAPEESFVSGTNLIEDNLSEPLLLSYGNVEHKNFTITNLAERIKNKVVKLYADIKWVGAEDDHNFYFHLNNTGNAYTFAMPRQLSFREPSPTREGYTRYWFRKEMAVISTSDMTDGATLGRVYINGNFSNANQSSLYVAEVGVMLETFSAGDDVGNALKRTGIDITNGKIVLDAETTVATGTFAAKQVISETDSMMTTVNGGSIVVSSKTTGSYGKFAINSIGEVILQMYDAEGKLILNIGGTPSSYQNAFWQLDAEMKYIGNNKPDASDCYVNSNTPGVLSYYQLTLGEVTNQDTTITYYYTDGIELSPQSTYANLINHNGATFKSKDYSLSDLNSNLSSYRITDGYYVSVNNGVFMTKTEDIGGGYKKTTYYATAYRYSGGFRRRIELITVKEEVLSPSA